MDKPWKVITAFIGVFVAGAVFGAFFSLGIGWRVVERNPPPTTALAAAVPPPPPAQPGRKMPPGQPWPASQPMQVAQIIRRLADRLDLTPAQRERIMPLIQRAVEDFRRQQANYFREDAFVLQRLQNDIAKELTPEQRKRLVEMEQRQRELLRRRQQEWQALQKSWENGGGGPGPHPAAPKPETNPPPESKPTGGASTGSAPAAGAATTSTGPAATTSPAVPGSAPAEKRD